MFWVRWMRRSCFRRTAAACCRDDNIWKNKKRHNKSRSKAQWHFFSCWIFFELAYLLFLLTHTIHMMNNAYNIKIKSIKSHKNNQYKMNINVYPSSIYLPIIWPTTYLIPTTYIYLHLAIFTLIFYQTYIYLIYLHYLHLPTTWIIERTMRIANK